MNRSHFLRRGTLVLGLAVVLIVAAVAAFLVLSRRPPGRDRAASAFGPDRASAPDDWPQWRGPNRDGVATATGLRHKWPSGGPRLLWTYTDSGAGYAAPAVVGGTVFLPGTHGDTEIVVVLDAATGTARGAAVLGPAFVNDWGGGPRATPAVSDGRLYACSGRGDLVCVDLATGQAAWRRHIYADFAGTPPTWGCGESPLVDGDCVLCTPGGPQGTVLALDRHTGQPLWRSTGWTEACGYSSLMPAEIGGVRQYVQMTFESIAGVAAGGRLLWRFPRPGPNAPVPTPLIAGDLVYATSGYGAGCHLVHIHPGDGFRTEQVYASKVLSNHHGGVVKVGAHLYGYADHKGWVCQELATGRAAWVEKAKFGKGSVTAAEGLLYCYAESDGTVCLVEAAPAGWCERGRFTIPRQSAQPRKQGGIWTHPVIAGGRLYLRDQELLFCYDVREEQ